MNDDDDREKGTVKRHRLRTVPGVLVRRAPYKCSSAQACSNNDDDDELMDGGDEEDAVVVFN